MSKLVVIGAGSGGLVTAIGAAQMGYDVTIIEKHKIGGDCTNYGCVPSKALLSRAHEIYATKQTLIKSGLTKPEIKKILSKITKGVMPEVRGVVKEFQDHESVDWLKSYNLDVRLGEAKFIDRESVFVNGSVIEYDKCVIATGSRPLIPDIDGLDGVDYLTNETVFELETLPSNLTIIGAGVIAVEMADAFASLGVKVVLLSRSGVVLREFDQEVAQIAVKRLEEKGVEIVTGSTMKVAKTELELEDGSKLKYGKLMIATGRVANTALDLEKAGVAYSKSGVLVNNKCVTSNSNVYAVGDCVSGAPNFTHYAAHMAGKVVTNLIAKKKAKIPINIAKAKSDYNPGVVFTSPEVATVGLTEKQAKQKWSKGVKVFRKKFKDMDRSKAEGEDSGVIKIVTKGKLGRVVGVHIVHERAGEMLPEFVDIVSRKRSIWSLNRNIRAYPTYTAGLDRVAREWLIGVISRSK